MVSPAMNPGTLALNPPLRIASLDAATFRRCSARTASGAQLLQLDGQSGLRRRLLLPQILDGRRRERGHRVLRAR